MAQAASCGRIIWIFLRDGKSEIDRNPVRANLANKRNATIYGLPVQVHRVAMKAFRILCLAALAVGLLTTTLPAYCQGGIGGVPGYPDRIDAYDPRELALLPEYCIYTQLFCGRAPGGCNGDARKQWYSVLGDAFDAMHHYCWGLMKTNRAILLARERKYRLYYLNESIDEFNYVLRYMPENHILMPEVLTRKGDNLIRLDRAALGIKDLTRAAKIKPDYWPPYAIMSDYYKATGNIEKAREVLQTGLSFSPDAKSLKRRLAEVDTAKN
jgi:hypothetical protein